VQPDYLAHGALRMPWQLHRLN